MCHSAEWSIHPLECILKMAVNKWTLLKAVHSVCWWIWSCRAPLECFSRWSRDGLSVFHMIFELVGWSSFICPIFEFAGLAKNGHFCLFNLFITTFPKLSFPEIYYMVTLTMSQYKYDRKFHHHESTTLEIVFLLKTGHVWCSYMMWRHICKCEEVYMSSLGARFIFHWLHCVYCTSAASNDQLEPW